MKNINSQTRERFAKFNKLRGSAEVGDVFWDVVVLTAVDETQKKAYEIQLDVKLMRKELPLSAKYIVVSDPDGPKIGNGGSTMVVIDELVRIFGEAAWTKKVLIIHAGGYSQRLPNASVLGKAFIGIPIGEPMYQAIELKLATYIDFPSKISGGGIFVCCADSIEVYNDNDASWAFVNDGFTALAHLSPVSIGKTHGVFVLDSPVTDESIVWTCRKFLHKPTIDLMESTENCVVLNDKNINWVMTDSAFFISVKTAKLLLKYYQNNKPLTCEIDAYGDFLQALGSNSTPDYTSSAKNVFTETSSLVATRKQIYDLLQKTSLHAVVFSSAPHRSQVIKKGEKSLSSIFYHIGTMPEYQYNFTKDTEMRMMLGISAITSCKGLPFTYSIDTEQLDRGGVKVSRQGALSCTINRVQCDTPCILGSVLQSNVSIGEGSIVEYSFLRESVSIGNNCIVSNCSFPKNAVVQSRVFMHTIAVISEYDTTMYATIIFSVDVDMKKSSPKGTAGKELKYFGSSLCTYFESSLQFSSANEVSLWNAKIFPLDRSMEESCHRACAALKLIGNDSKTRLYEKDEDMYSMEDLLKKKDLPSSMQFRDFLYKEIQSTVTSSHLGSLLLT